MNEANTVSSTIIGFACVIVKVVPPVGKSVAKSEDLMYILALSKPVPSNVEFVALSNKTNCWSKLSSPAI